MNLSKEQNRIFLILTTLLKDSGKTDLNSQIKAIEMINKNVIKTPLFISIKASLKELQGIKRNQMKNLTQKN